jgi:hypothetical protein
MRGERRRRIYSLLKRSLHTALTLSFTSSAKGVTPLYCK